MGYSNELKRTINFMGPFYTELVVYLNRSLFISNEAQKSSECKQRCPLNGREPIHVAVLKAVKRASTGFVGETSNSSGTYRTKNGGKQCVSITDLEQQYQGVKQRKQMNHGVDHKMVKSCGIL
jgi:hypothetical protein